MRSRARAAILHGVMDTHARDPIRLVLELDCGAEPIAGRLTAPDGDATPFRGWLLLATLIESARKDAPGQAGRGASGYPARDPPSSV